MSSGSLGSGCSSQHHRREILKCVALARRSPKLAEGRKTRSLARDRDAMIDTRVLSLSASRQTRTLRNYLIKIVSLFAMAIRWLVHLLSIMLRFRIIPIAEFRASHFFITLIVTIKKF